MKIELDNDNLFKGPGTKKVKKMKKIGPVLDSDTEDQAEVKNKPNKVMKIQTKNFRNQSKKVEIKKKVEIQTAEEETKVVSKSKKLKLKVQTQAETKFVRKSKFKDEFKIEMQSKPGKNQIVNND